MASELISPEGVLATAGAKLLYDVFGDSAKVFGKKLGSYSQAGVDNLERVLKKAYRRMKARAKTDGDVPVRVIQHVLTEAYFCEDEVQAEYLGGILASAKGPVARDDRAVSHITLLSSLSTYQIRTHYLLYGSILRWKGQYADQMLKWLAPHRGITVAIAEEDYQIAMDFSAAEPVPAICQHIFAGLNERGLSEGGLSVVLPNPNVRGQPDPPFRYFYPTVLGIELFMFGLGHGDQTIDAFTAELLMDESLPPSLDPLHIELGRVNW
jgi:hypothetical protein